MNAWHSLLSTVAAFFPPDLSPGYLLALMPSVAETIGMTAGAMLVAYAVSLPVGLWIGARLPGAWVLTFLLSGVRAIPDLTLAIFCVIALGVGPGAGMLALAIYYAAAVGKIFGDLFRTADAGPLEALRAAGASRTQVALVGMLPLKLKDLLSYGSYEFESAIRASVIVGAVGGGGIGAELVGTLNAFDFQRTATLILILIALVSLFDQFTVVLRRDPRWLAALLPPALYCLWRFWPATSTLAHAATSFAGMFPPSLGAAAWHKLPDLFMETLEMALFGTALGAAAALPLGLLSARNLSPIWVAAPVRRLLEALRAVPEVVWGLVLVAAAGVGPFAGTLALAVHSAGCLGRLFAESLENVRPAPVLAIASTGASAVAIAGYATLPLALGPLGVHTLFRLEWNVRQATVVGMIGAGGIGQALYESQQLFFYSQMIAYLLLTWILVIAVDRGSEWTRRRFGWMQLAPEEIAR
jgi:phosphonate transport system permease protein